MNAAQTAEHTALIIKVMQAQAGGKVQGPRPCPLLEVHAGDEFIEFKHAFIAAAKINHWDNARARLELSGAMRGPARQTTSRIPTNEEHVEGTQDAADFKQLLEVYEHAFFPEDARDSYAERVIACRQRQDETTVAWHCRLEETYLRAHPTIASADGGLEEWRPIRQLFLDGLYDPAVRIHARNLHPETYSAALADANTAVAVVQSTRRCDGVVAVAPEILNIAAIGEQQQKTLHSPGKLCNVCDSPRHFQRDCPIWLKLKARYPDNFGPRRFGAPHGRGASRGRASFGGSGQRGGSSRGRGGRGRGGRGARASNQSLQEMAMNTYEQRAAQGASAAEEALFE